MVDAGDIVLMVEKLLAERKGECQPRTERATTVGPASNLGRASDARASARTPTRAVLNPSRRDTMLRSPQRGLHELSVADHRQRPDSHQR